MGESEPETKAWGIAHFQLKATKGQTAIARGMLVKQDHPVASMVTRLNVPFHFSGLGATIKMPAPLLGEHNKEIARDLGFSEAEVQAMQGEGVLYAEPSA
ncbi:MAG: hypothetical protein HC765_00155 [Brachymonas sp.]|nr:hypothetical protein [Brachymonas sp.]